MHEHLKQVTENTGLETTFNTGDGNTTVTVWRATGETPFDDNVYVLIFTQGETETGREQVSADDLEAKMLELKDPLSNWHTVTR